MSDVTVTLGADAGEFKGALTEIQRSMDTLANSTVAKTARIGQAFSGVKDIVSTVCSTIEGSIHRAFDFVAPAAAIERVEKDLTGLTGSAEEARRIIGSINEWALTSQYTPTDMFRNAVDLVRGGISESLAPDLVRQLATIAQGDQGKMDALIAGLTKGSGGLKGFGSKVMESFNAARVDLMGAMEMTTGLSGDALKEKLKEGIGFDEVAAAIRELAKDGGALKNAEQEAGKSWMAILKKFENAWGNLQENFGAGLLEPLGAFMESVDARLLGWSDGATEWGQKAGEMITKAGEAVIRFGEAAGPVLAFVERHGRLVADALAAVTLGFVLMRLQAVPTFAQIKIMCTQMTAWTTLAKTGFASMWASFAAGARAAMVAVKSAIISSGIGALIVAAGEGVAYLYRAISDRPGNSDDEGKSDEDGRLAGERIRNSQMIDNEWRAYESGMGKARSETDVYAIGDRILNNLHQAEQELAVIRAEQGGMSTAWSNQREYVMALSSMYDTFRADRAKALDGIRSQAESEKRMAQLAKAREEAEKKAEQNRKELRKMQEDWMKSEVDRAYQDRSLAERGNWINDEAVRLGASTGVDGVNARMKELSEQEPTEGVMKQMQALNDLRKKYVDLEDARKGYEKQVSGARMNQEAMAAEIAGLEVKAQKLRDEMAVRDKMESYRKSGMSDEDAGKMARRDVALDRIKGSKSVEEVGLGSIIKQSGVEVGNGGKSLGLSSSILGESQKQSASLQKIFEMIARWKPGDIVLTD